MLLYSETSMYLEQWKQAPVNLLFWKKKKTYSQEKCSMQGLAYSIFLMISFSFLH